MAIGSPESVRFPDLRETLAEDGTGQHRLSQEQNTARHPAQTSQDFSET
jgi:hypothetical protein